MNKRTRPCGLGAAIIAVATGATLPLGAITQAEWEADHSLIPTPSASSAFYVVAPTALAGVQIASAYASGLDSSPTEREYEFDFDTDLTTRCGATVIMMR